MDPSVFASNDTSAPPLVPIRQPQPRSLPLFDHATATAAATAARAARASSTLRRDYQDDAIWVDLARQRGLRLPIYGTPCTPASMERWLRKLGVSLHFYQEQWGFETLGEAIAVNPDMPLRAFVGFCLEEMQ